MKVVLKEVSWERMSNAVGKVRERLLRVSRALERARLPYAVVGGNAVAAWVSRVDESAVRNTRDVDVLLQRDTFAEAVRALEGEGFVHRKVASLGRAGTMDIFLEGAGGKVRDAVHVIFAGEKVRPDSAEPNPGVSESESTGEFQLIALEALVRMKLDAFRDKDRVHLRDLVEVGLVDSTWLDRLAEPLRSRLQTILENPEA